MSASGAQSRSWRALAESPRVRRVEDVLDTGANGTIGGAIEEHLADEPDLAVTDLDREPHRRWRNRIRRGGVRGRHDIINESK